MWEGRVYESRYDKFFRLPDVSGHTFVAEFVRPEYLNPDGSTPKTKEDYVGWKVPFIDFPQYLNDITVFFSVARDFLLSLDTFILYLSKGGINYQALEDMDQYTKMRYFDEFESLYKKINPSDNNEVDLDGQ